MKEIMNTKLAIQEILKLCTLNGFGFNYEPGANSKDKKVVSVRYRFNRGFTGYSFEQKFYFPITETKEQCVRDVLSMINAGDSVIDIKRHISEFVPF